ncbi:MAG: hypothetical protein ABSB18_07740 [Candidatus Omnitrophota bacterium]
MTKSRLFSKNTVRAALNSFLFLYIVLFFGCSPSSTPTYSIENIDTAIQDICKKEYKLDVKVKTVGKTLWLYMPKQDILEKTKEKYTDKFEIESNEAVFEKGRLQIKYSIKAIPDTDKIQEYKYTKSVLENVSNAWKVIRRVVFSMENSQEDQPHFFCLIAADTVNGIELRQIFYYLDMKRIFYGLMSWEEYSHREIQHTKVDSNITGDEEGRHVDYHGISMEEFLADQIQQRIKVKFQKPEVGKNADIDKEIVKVVAYTIKNYGMKDFSFAELDNLIGGGKIILNRAALWEEPTE